MPRIAIVLPHRVTRDVHLVDSGGSQAAAFAVTPGQRPSPRLSDSGLRCGSRAAAFAAALGQRPSRWLSDSGLRCGSRAAAFAAALGQRPSW